VKVGYLIPEFPSQTHSFFWREKQALEKLGIKVEVVSTRRPQSILMPHSWTAQAVRETVYLFPPPTRLMAAAFHEMLRAGPARWWHCLRVVACVNLPSLPRRLRILPLVAVGAQLAAIAQQRQWSHIHVHSCADCANVALFAHLLSGIPYSLTLHGPLEHYGPNQREKWRHARFAMVVTETLRKQVADILAGSLPGDLFVAPMGVDSAKFSRRTPYTPYRGAGTFAIFSCSRLNRGKGHDTLIRSVARLRDCGITVRLRIAGEDDSGTGSCRKGLEQLINELALNEQVKLLGALPEEAVRDELEGAHVFALASRNEAIGVATMEAMAMALPVVATNVGGVPELVDHGKNGLLVQPDEPRQLADALAAIALHPDQAACFGGAGQRKVECFFHSGVSAQQIARRLATPLQKKGDTRWNGTECSS